MTESTRSFPKVVAVLVGIFFTLGGLWAMVAPESFYDNVATFEPYNQHFIQDIGAFQIGLGAVLLIAALAARDVLGTALLGVGIGSAAHTVSHIIGADLGGSPARDITFHAVMTLVLLAGGWMRWRA